MPNDDYTTVTVSCPVCNCDAVVEQGWHLPTQSLVGTAALLATNDENMPMRGQLHECVCHTGVGMLPRMKVRIG